MMTDCDVAIVGAGPAGITAAVQLKREGLVPLIFERDEVGGTIRIAWRVENFPAFAAGVEGKTMAARMAEHLSSFDIKPIRADIEEIKADMYFTLKSARRKWTAKAVILACGLVPTPLTLPEFVRVFYWKRSELPKKEGASVLMIGGGDVAFDQASRWANCGFQVTLLHRSPPKALGRIIARAKSDGVRIVQSVVNDWETSKTKVYASDFDKDTPFDYIVGHIGREKKPPAVTQKGRLIQLERVTQEGESECENLFVVGDIGRGHERQVSIAMGDGMLAALTLAKRLKG